MTFMQEVALSEAEPILIVGSYLLGSERFTRLWPVILNIRSHRLDSPMSKGGPRDLVHQGGLLRRRAWAQFNPILTKEGSEDRGIRFGRAFERAMARQGPAAFEATIPHDYLYSMIGLCGGSELLPPELAPDYQKSFPRVCEDYARCIIKATGSVAILARTFWQLWPDYDEALAEDLPSWVPDFRASQRSLSVEGDVDPPNVSFAGPDGELLKVRGYDSEKVIRVYIPLACEDDDDNYSFSEHLRHHHKFLVDVARESNISLEEAVANWLHSKILVGRETSWATKPAVEDLQALYDRYLQQDGGGDDSRTDSLQDSDIAKKFVQLVRMKIIDGGKAKFLCQGGTNAELRRLCAEPPSRGDRLVALSGGACPFLLRPVTTDFGLGYVNLGHCWSWYGASMLYYASEDYSLELYDESEFEYFMLT